MYFFKSQFLWQTAVNLFFFGRKISALISICSAGIGTTAAVTVGKAEVVPSRKAQKAQAAAVAMPPPPPPSMSSARPNQAAPPPGQAAPQPYPVPGWACMPAAAAQLDVLKDGATIQCIPLHKPSTVFGR